MVKLSFLLLFKKKKSEEKRIVLPSVNKVAKGFILLFNLNH